MKTGLCSITFRQLTCRQLVDLVKQAGLDAIEWGGDVHVPPGNIAAAREAKKLTLDAGLTVSSYGSYYKVIDEKGAVQDSRPVLDSTLALGADTIRIWAGGKGSDVVDAGYRRRLVEACRLAVQAAADEGIRVAFEFHNHTLTDTNESAALLLHELNHPNAYLYWQPMYWGPELSVRIQGLRMLHEKVLNFHVFHWRYDSSKSNWAEAVDRRPLHEGAPDWEKYLSVPLPEKERFALIEFVRGDSAEQFLKDACTLKRWVGGQ